MKKMLLARPFGAGCLFVLFAWLGTLPGWGQSALLEQWALTTDNSATTVAPGAVASVPTLVGFLASSATTPKPSANSAFGQAIAPAADGGSWGNTQASPSTRYEEFIYTVAAGYTARLDSLVLSTSLYGGSNGRASVAYSTNGFATSTFLQGSISGTMVNGVMIVNTSNATAATDPYQVLRFPLVSGGATTGLNLSAGSTVAFRLYYGIATNSTGRYALLRSFSVKGQSASVGSVSTTTADVSFTTPAAGGYTYTISTNPSGGTATLSTAPSAGNNYLATYTLSGLTANTAYTATVAGTNGVVSTTITSPSFTTTTAPLPVELVKFEAARQGRNVLLTWKTASELNNKGFEVQVSATGNDFRTLGFVAGAGSSLSARSYQYLDAIGAAQPGLRYYRLRQLDLDGTATYSPTRVVQMEVLASTALQAAPNPFGGDALVLYTQAATATQTTLRLTDALGRVVRTQLLAVPTGAAQLALPGLADLPAGLYVVEIVLDGQPQRLKLVRE